MKRVLALFVVVSLFITGCGDDDNDKDYLEGTTWEAVDEYTDSGEWYKDVFTLRFDKNICKMKAVEYYREDGVEKSYTYEQEGTYTYDPPKVTLTMTDEDGTDTEILTVDGDKMTTTPDEEGYFLVFHKK